MFQARVVDKIRTYIVCVCWVTRLLRSCLLWGNVEKYCRAGQATDDNMAHAHCMLDTLGYKHTLRLYNTYRFSTTTMVARTRLNFTLYVHCLSLFFCTLASGKSWGNCRQIHRAQGTLIGDTGLLALLAEYSFKSVLRVLVFICGSQYWRPVNEFGIPVTNPARYKHFCTFMVTPCINNIQYFNNQLTHTTLKNVKLLKHSKIS